jgi:hypothetical protein
VSADEVLVICWVDYLKYVGIPNKSDNDNSGQGELSCTLSLPRYTPQQEGSPYVSTQLDKGVESR